MTNEQYQAAKNLRREIRCQKMHISHLEIEIATGGRRYTYADTPEDKERDEALLARAKDKLATLEQMFTAL